MLVTPIEDLYISGVCLKPGTLYRLTKINDGTYNQKVYNERVKDWIDTSVVLYKVGITSAITTNRLIVFSKSYEAAIIKKTQKLKEEKAKMDYEIMQELSQRISNTESTTYYTNGWDASDLTPAMRQVPEPEPEQGLETASYVESRLGLSRST